MIFEPHAKRTLLIIHPEVNRGRPTIESTIPDRNILAWAIWKKYDEGLSVPRIIVQFRITRTEVEQSIKFYGKMRRIKNKPQNKTYFAKIKEWLSE